MSAQNRVLVLAAVVALVAFVPAGVASAAPDASAISVGESATSSPDDAITAAPGETVTVTVWANASSVSGYQTELAFDPAVVRVEAVSGGDDFADPVANVNNEEGRVAFNQLRSSDGDDPVLAELTLTVIGDAGESTALSFERSETKFATDGGQTFAPSTYNDVTVGIEEETTETPTATETETPDGATETPNGTIATETATPTATETPNDATTSETPNETTETETRNDTTATETPVTETETPTPTDPEQPVGEEQESGGDGDDDSGDSESDDDDDRSSGGGGGYSAPDEPSFSIESAQVNATNQTAGGPVTVSAVVENSGDADGEYDARLSVDGSETDQSRTVDVDAGETRTVNFSVSFDSPGTYALAINGVAAGNLTVEASNASTATAAETTTATATLTDTAATAAPTAASTETTAAATPSDTSGGETDASSPGFGFLAALATLSLLVCWSALRREDE